MTTNFKTLLKTTAAVATLMMGAQSWGATVYAPGTEVSRERYDTVTLGGAGDFDAFTAPSSTIEKLFLTFSTPVAIGAVAANTAVAATDIPATVKEIWYHGDALGLSTTNGAAANALPTPPANSIIHFNLSVSPAAAATWFISTIPSTCSIIVEKGSADPKLAVAHYAAAKSVQLGINLSLAAITFSGKVFRSPKVAEADLATMGQLTVTGNAVFSKGIRGLKLVGGANALTFNDASDLPDLTSTGAWTVAAGKKVVIRDVNSTFNLSAPSSYTLGAGSEITLKH